MRPPDLVALLVLILCSLPWHSVRGDVVEEEHFMGKSETDTIRPSLKETLKAIETEKLVSTNSRAQFHERALKPLVLEEDELKVAIILRQEDTSRIDHNLERPSDPPINAKTWNDFPCPDAASIAPCVCTFDVDFNIDLNCTNVESEEQLVAVFKQEFPTKELHRFSMATNNKLRVIGNILNGFTFQYIYFGIGPFTFEVISEYFLLSNKESLITLHIFDSQIISETFPFAILGEMKKTDPLTPSFQSLDDLDPENYGPGGDPFDIDVGMIDTIETGTFPIRADGMEVQLDGNRIATIEPVSFYFVDENSATSNGYLRLDLRSNQLQSLEAGVYLLRNGFGRYYFNNNQISYIEPGTFVLPQTTDQLSVEFNLSVNLLTTIDEDIFGELFPFITTFSIYDNPLFCGCDIAWLVVNRDYMAKIDADATCADGANLHTLDPVLYESVCYLQGDKDFNTSSELN